MDKEFYEINKDILENSKFNELKKYKHHGITRYEHCLRVAYYTYIVTRKRNKNYKEVTRAALLHDFFTDEVENLSSFKRFYSHPKHAIENSKKYFNISKLQEDIIKSHMFPIGLTVPKHKESWLVDLIDDYSAVVERLSSFKLKLATTSTFLIMSILNFIKMR